VNGLVGSLADGRVLLTLAVLAGLGVGVVGSSLARLVGHPVPDNSVLAVAGGLLGVLAVFLGHVAWHAR
jgi:VIT1/CCC1 family predicted Fe2+/Mn2+ transporter